MQEVTCRCQGVGFRTLVVAHAEQVGALFVVLLDLRAHAGDRDQFGDRVCWGAWARKNPGLGGRAHRPAHQQCVGESGTRRLVLDADRDRRPVVVPLTLGALPARATFPDGLVQAGEHLVGAGGWVYRARRAGAGPRRARPSRSARRGRAARPAAEGHSRSRSRRRSTPNITSAVHTRSSMRITNSGFVTKPRSAGTPASAQRSGSSVQRWGRYSSRSMKAPVVGMGRPSQRRVGVAQGCGARCRSGLGGG